MSNNASFFSELRRRNVFRVALTYAVVAWLLLEIAGVFVPMLDAPEWIITAFLVILALGFVLAMFISWSFEMTPEGLKRTEDLSPDEVIPYWSRRKFARFIIGTAVIAFGLSAYQLLRPRSSVRISQTEPLSISQSSTADSLRDNAATTRPAERILRHLRPIPGAVAKYSVVFAASESPLWSYHEFLRGEEYDFQGRFESRNGSWRCHGK